MVKLLEALACARLSSTREAPTGPEPGGGVGGGARNLSYRWLGDAWVSNRPRMGSVTDRLLITVLLHSASTRMREREER